MLLLASLVLVVNAQDWHHTSQPVNLACLKAPDMNVITTSHEKVVDLARGTDSCVDNGWNNVIVKSQGIQSYQNCQKAATQAPFTPQNCDVGCTKQTYRILEDNASTSISSSPLEWDKTCSAIATHIANVTSEQLQSADNFVNYSLFARAPGYYLRVHKFAAGSNCNDVPIEIQLYPVYDTCTNMNTYFLQSRYANNTLQHLVCKDSQCQDCQVGVVKASQTNCAAVNGAVYKSMYIHDYISPRIGFFVAKAGPDTSSPQTTSNGGSLAVIIIFSGLIVVLVAGALIYFQRKKKNTTEEYFDDTILRSAISNHLEKKMAKSSASSTASVSSVSSNVTKISNESAAPPAKVMLGRSKTQTVNTSPAALKRSNTGPGKLNSSPVLSSNGPNRPNSPSSPRQRSNEPSSPRQRFNEPSSPSQRPASPSQRPNQPMSPSQLSPQPRMVNQSPQAGRNQPVRPTGQPLQRSISNRAEGGIARSNSARAPYPRTSPGVDPDLQRSNSGRMIRGQPGAPQRSNSNSNRSNRARPNQ